MNFSALKRYRLPWQGSEFFRHVAMLITGTVLAQLVTVLSTPIITRTYGAEQFGVFGVFMALVALLATLATGRYNMAIMLTKKNDEASNVFVICMGVTFVVTLLSTPLLFFGDSLASLLETPKLEELLYLLPAAVLLFGVHQSIDQWSCRNKQFAIISSAALVAAVLSNLLKITFGFVAPVVDWLVAGSLINVLVQIAWQIKARFKLNISNVSVQKSVILLRRYRYLPMYRAPKDMLSSISENAPVLIMAMFFGPTQVGFYTLADRIMRLPGLLVGQAVRKVLFQKASEARHAKQSLMPLWLKSTSGMAFLAFLPFLLVFVFGPRIFTTVFGSEWSEAGQYAQWIAIGMFFGFINVPSVVLVPVLKLEKYFLLYEIVSIVIRLSALLYGCLIVKSILLAVALFCVFGAFLNVVLIGFVYYRCRISDSSDLVKPFEINAAG